MNAADRKRLVYALVASHLYPDRIPSGLEIELIRLKLVEARFAAPSGPSAYAWTRRGRGLARRFLHATADLLQEALLLLPPTPPPRAAPQKSRPHSRPGAGLRIRKRRNKGKRHGT